MSEPSTASPPPKGAVRRLWKPLWSPSARFSLAGLLIVGGALAGVVLWGGFNWGT